jgi:hypothetical protein
MAHGHSVNLPFYQIPFYLSVVCKGQLSQYPFTQKTSSILMGAIKIHKSLTKTWPIHKNAFKENFKA